jgi:hypothetical protein
MSGELPYNFLNRLGFASYPDNQRDSSDTDTDIDMAVFWIHGGVPRLRPGQDKISQFTN